MLPTMGDLVLYHFSNVYGRMPAGLLNVGPCTRPALVISEPDGDGRALLQPFYALLDEPTANHTGMAGPGVIPALPHREPSGEIGVIGKAGPKPGTWSWRPTRPGAGEAGGE